MHPWVRRFMIIISAWWLRISSKFIGKNSKKQSAKRGNGQLLIGCGFDQDIAPPSLFRDIKIKLEQTNKPTLFVEYIDQKLALWIPKESKMGPPVAAETLGFGKFHFMVQIE